MDETIKNKVKKDAKVLLISGDEQIINGVKKYGFKNLNIVKSIVVANNYFQNHPEELDSYDLILSNVKRYTGEYDKLWIEKEIGSFDRKNLCMKIHETNENEFDYSEYFDIKPFYMVDSDQPSSWDYAPFRGGSIEEALDYIYHITANLLKDTPKEIKPIVLPKKELSLPKKKSDLKILFYGWLAGYSAKVIEHLGVTIEFLDENFKSMGDVFTKLGNYDIVIGGTNYLKNLTKLDRECTEQCQLSGRKLVLLANYNTNYWLDDGYKICISSVEAGKLATKKTKEETFINFINGSTFKTQMPAIVEEVVNLYNEALARANQKQIEDLDFRTLEEINKPYNDFHEKFIKEEQEALEEISQITSFIREIDAFRKVVIKYMSLQNGRKIKSFPENVIIDANDKEITIKCLSNGLLLSTLTMPNSIDIISNVRLFKCQSLTKKRNLSAPQVFGIYSSRYIGVDDLPPRATEKQIDILRATMKKVNNELVPLIYNTNEDDYTYKKKYQGK